MGMGPDYKHNVIGSDGEWEFDTCNAPECEVCGVSARQRILGEMAQYRAEHPIEKGK